MQRLQPINVAALLLISATIITSLPSVGLALHHPSHGSLDLRYAWQNSPNPFVDHYVDTGCRNYLPSGACGHKVLISDRALVKAISLAPVSGFVFQCPDCEDPPPFPDGPESLRITTFYGRDANPGSPNEFAQLTGFTNGAPEAIFSAETYIGLTQEYAADSLGTYQLSELSSAFPDFDFSMVVGDPSSIVYAFTAVVPQSDFAVPEPSALLLAGLAVAAIAVRRRAPR